MPATKNRARDLEFDLSICERWDLGNPDITNEFVRQALEGWPYAIRRALAAEAEIDRLRNELNILQQQLYGSEVYGIGTSAL
ncbi:hypothetical protein PACILC2_21660 [Paenibacillus cisolokensis]|uniref:Uncharacterized protein n=1 Tax=Paenibacillus cisolokensis TaxID=1658519 RepID=A0ABQ4N5Y7_9BACL|nr:hypothetical protein [Paenibacillus cisolokensis]GIQ63598.1 hypothetical protein PACILC2_21660 [Paenibacillus cisolokensis]